MTQPNSLEILHSIQRKSRKFRALHIRIELRDALSNLLFADFDSGGLTTTPLPHNDPNRIENIVLTRLFRIDALLAPRIQIIGETDSFVSGPRKAQALVKFWRWNGEGHGECKHTEPEPWYRISTQRAPCNNAVLHNGRD